MIKVLFGSTTKEEIIVFKVIKDMAIGLGLAISIPLAMIQGIKTSVKEPSFKTIYKCENTVRDLRNKVEDLRSKGQKEEALKVKDELKKAKEELAKSKAEYETDMNRYVQIYLIIALIVGITIALLGLMLEAEFLSIGSFMGGILCVVYGISFGWHSFNDMMRFFIVIGTLISIILVEYLLFLRWGGRQGKV